MDLYDLTAKDLSPRTIEQLINIYKSKMEHLEYEHECALKELDEKFQDKRQKYETVLLELSDFLEEHRPCQTCQGIGLVTEYDNAWDNDGHSVKCPECKGRGYLK